MSNICKDIHILFNSIPKLNFPFNDKDIPQNGIYILFEKEEFAHHTNRIVRVGTHTGKNQLPSRIKQHFIQENKDRSIFRKNIGRAILNKNNDSFLKEWEIDLTTKNSKNLFYDKINHEKQKTIEKEVTKYIQDNFSFVVFPIDNKSKRIELESKIISTISNCNECKASKDWLGNFSPKEKIKKGGLWLVNELWKNPLTEEDFEELKAIIKSH